MNSPSPKSADTGELKVGARLTLTVGDVVQGGHCIARHDGRVIFVRYAIPGEKVIVEITSITSKVVRGDAIEILEPSTDRIEPACKYFYPGGCGGCDFQHIAPAAQARFKARIIAEQFSRLAGVDIEVSVSRIEPSVQYRNHMTYALSPRGTIGFYGSRSKRIIEIDQCLLASKAINSSGIYSQNFRGVNISAAQGSTGEVTISSDWSVLQGPPRTQYEVLGHRFDISPESFWQSHLNAAEVLVKKVKEFSGVLPGESVADLYGGVGLFTSFLSEMVGSAGQVHLIESSGPAILDAKRIFRDRSNVAIHEGRVERELSRISHLDRVLLDPPRVGAGEVTMNAILSYSPKSILYISCDPATLARDAKVLLEGGYRLHHIEGLDLFPMTQHVETVALFLPA